MSTVGNYLISKNEKVNEEVKPTALDKFRKASAEREVKHKEIEKNQSKDGSGMTSAIDRLEKHMNKEEVEQIDEISKKTVKSWLKQQPVVPEKKPGMDRKAHNQKIKLRSKSWDSAIDRLTDRKPTSEEIESIEEDTKKEWSKSARIIKSIYKTKGVKEETYDFEKDDKLQGFSTGKKPKILKSPENDNVGENKPDARAIMVGGKTMTGEKRDTIEIDPFMRKPKTNAPDAFDKPVDKKDH
jgi:hypothetical protein